MGNISTRDLGRIASPIVNRLLWMIQREVSLILYPIAKAYTPLALLVFFIIGNFFIFVLAYWGRYDRFDFWRWRVRAISSMVRWTMILVISKIVLTGGISV